MPQPQTIKRTCEQCGKHFFARPYFVRRGHARYCSLSCYRTFKDAPLEIRFWRYVNRTKGCWQWTAHVDRDGYGHIAYQGTSKLSHRVSWIIHNGEIPRGMLVCHHCDNPTCVRPSHLFLGTTLDNSRDTVSKGRSLYGSKNQKAKLTWKSVIAIRRQASSLGCYAASILAKQYGLSCNRMRDAIVGRSWKH